MKMYHYIVKGRVQGVFFRHHTKETAERLKISGTVRNLPNGDVEVFAQGDPSAISGFERYLHQGPPMGSVEEVITKEIESTDILKDFRIIH